MNNEKMNESLMKLANVLTSLAVKDADATELAFARIEEIDIANLETILDDIKEYYFEAELKDHASVDVDNLYNEMMQCIEEKVQKILKERKLKYDWVVPETLTELVLSEPSIDAHDPRVDSAVNTDFFRCALEMLQKGKEIEIDSHDFNGLIKEIRSKYCNYSVQYISPSSSGLGKMKVTFK